MMRLIDNCLIVIVVAFHLNLMNEFVLFTIENYSYQIDREKAKTLQMVADFYGIKKDHIIVFGDAPNDKEMLKEYPISFFMCNGIDGFSHCAKYITEYDNNHDGVARELIKFFDIKNEYLD